MQVVSDTQTLIVGGKLVKGRDGSPDQVVEPQTVPVGTPVDLADAEAQSLLDRGLVRRVSDPPLVLPPPGTAAAAVGTDAVGVTVSTG